ncbi:type II toxin-antitoxin system VapC family toxin [Aminobacter sp. HY435]|uniref:type II toxin-antitoxin system VapC family toxin n=1 Tax=Aminobacter sp. HY435 TaxID=2970917 RepID=UPI0022B983AC|nr:type II toxin-antitoxin system VapC family toxin [Aminobacter sp. HY435]
MKVAVDTNVLARAMLADDPGQTRVAQALLADAELIVIPLVTFCELVWVLGSLRIERSEIAQGIEGLLSSRQVAADHAAVAAGLAHLRAGGDFADAAMADEGYRAGAEQFTTFDKNAARLLAAEGRPVTLLKGRTD